MVAIADRPTILLVEDDARIAELVGTYLEGQGYDVSAEADGARGAARIVAERPDLVILDWMLPSEDGLSVCRRVRAAGFGGPILMLTARTDEVDQILGLEMGADDYVPKPVRPRLLLARLRALERRGRPAEPDQRVSLGDLIVDRARREVMVAGRAVVLTTAEFELLWLLAMRSGEPVDRETLFRELRGIAFDGVDRSMDMRVSTVRKRLQEADPHSRTWIVTVRGVGYQLVQPAS